MSSSTEVIKRGQKITLSESKLDNVFPANRND